MKKLFILLATVCGFVACNDDAETLAVDFSNLPTEEVMKMEGGMEYILATYDDIDYAAINEQMQRGVLHVSGRECDYYLKENGRWKPFVWFAGKWVTSDLFLMAEGNKMRMCYANIFGEEGSEEPRYFEWQNKQANAWEGALTAFVIGEKRVNLRAAAHFDNKIVVSYEDEAGEEFLQVWVLRDIRQEVINACSWDASEQFKHIIEDLEKE